MTNLQIAGGDIEYYEAGSGPTLVFVHGALVDGQLWKDVVPLLSRTHRCIVPDWPMGSHRLPMAESADLSPTGMARVIAGALDALDLRDVTLVGSDTGGAVCQLLCAERPARVARLILTNCDALEVFPPPEFAYLRTVQTIPGLPWLAAQVLARSPRRRRAHRAYGGLTAHPVDDSLLRRWVAPIATQSEIRRDLKKLILGMHHQLTLEAAKKLAKWNRPMSVLWGVRDPFFSVSLGERLAKAVGARFSPIEDASTFVALDQPERLAQLISAA